MSEVIQIDPEFDSSAEGKLLTDLKVTELRSELEKRGRDKNGVKATLTERLAEALQEEGHDPESYLFPIVSDVTPGKGSAAKRKTITPVKNSRDEDGKGADDGDHENSRSDNNKQASESHPPPAPSAAAAVAVNDSEPSLEEADNIVQDALQLAENDELNEYRDLQDCDDEEDPQSSKLRTKAIPVASETRTPAPAAAIGASSATTTESGSKSSRSSRATDSNGLRAAESEKSVPGKDDGATAGPSAGDARGLDADSGAQSASTASSKKSGKSSSVAKKDSDDKSGRSGRDSEKKDGKSSSSSSSSKAKSSSSSVVTTAADASKNSSSTASKDDQNDTSDRNIWVGGLSQNDRASDLQSIFKKFGKVVGAKIITNTRIPGSRYYGLITMETKEQAEKCILNLNKTELNGKTITVEKNRPKDSAGSTGKESGKDKDSSAKSHREKDSDREKNRPKDKSRDKDKESGNKNKDLKSRDRGREKEKSSRRSKSPVRGRDGKKSPPRRNRSRSPFRARGLALRGGRGMPAKRPFIPRDTRMNPLELRRIEADRLARRRERLMRESEQRRQEDDRRQRELLQIEAEKLRRERELLEKEKAELLRLEREKARLERERIEREKEEILRKVSHERDFSRSRAAVSTPASVPVALKRSYDSRDPDPYWDSDRKRQGIPDSLAPAARMTFDTTSAARFEFDSRGGGAPAVSQDRFAVRGSNDYGMDSRRDNGRPDRDDRSRTMAAAPVSNPGFYRSDMRDSRRTAAPGGRGDEATSWKSESRRDRPPPTVSSMISVSGSSVGPQGMYSATTGAPLGPIMSHSSLSSAPIGSAQLDSRSYVHAPLRRFPS